MLVVEPIPAGTHTLLACSLARLLAGWLACLHGEGAGPYSYGLIAIAYLPGIHIRYTSRHRNIQRRSTYLGRPKAALNMDGQMRI